MQLLTPAFGLIIWTLLAFLIVFFILKKFAWKPILDSMNKREEGIADSLATAEKIKLESILVSRYTAPANISKRKNKLSACCPVKAISFIFPFNFPMFPPILSLILERSFQIPI